MRSNPDLQAMIAQVSREGGSAATSHSSMPYCWLVCVQVCSRCMNAGRGCAPLTSCAGRRHWQVAHDQKLLHERIERLTGAEGVKQLEEALAAARTEVEQNGEWETSSER